ncbi:(2Fe-2S)-binding protein [Bradyrhizobium sp. USDA 4449]
MKIERLPISVTVNGVAHSRDVEPRLTLADFLRHELALTGTHVGCEHGVCGACTVLVDGKSVRSCLMFAVQANGELVETVEGLAPDEQTLHPLQRAFSAYHALQCGFCTSGLLMTIIEFLRTTSTPDEAAVRDTLSGNICRCTGYQGIVEAVLATARGEFDQPPRATKGSAS